MFLFFLRPKVIAPYNRAAFLYSARDFGICAGHNLMLFAGSLSRLTLDSQLRRIGHLRHFAVISFYIEYTATRTFAGGT
jgi:hypothetical protein